MKITKRSNIYDPFSSQKRYIIFAIFGLSLIGMGFLLNSPKEILSGLIAINKAPSGLITDYFVIGGQGATFINAGLLTLVFLYLMYFEKVKFGGISIAALLIMSGFAMFGKNLINVWFIAAGVYLYAKVQKERFSRYIYIAIFGTAMSPLISELMLVETGISFPLRVLLGVTVGIGIGFLLPPLSSYLLKVHQGFNLYNIGFTAGILGTIVVSVLKGYGFSPTPKLYWYEGMDLPIIIYLLVVFFAFIVTGLVGDRAALQRGIRIMKYPGRLVTDFVIIKGTGATLVNMGLTGILSLTYLILIGGDLNGPTIGGLLTIVGFSAFGKHPKNILPIFVGVLLGGLTKTWSIVDPSMQLAALFGTALAPIAGEFGFSYGVLAAYLHSSVVQYVGTLHGGLNLYNNGFSAGLVAAVLVPIIEAFKGEEI